MTSIVSGQHHDDFRSLGYTVFRKVVPASLIGDLRRAHEAGRAQVRAQEGGQAQRFQPIAAFAVDRRPFVEFRQLEPLRRAIVEILGPDHASGDPATCGVLIEPKSSPWTMAWHRDWRDNSGCDPRDWHADRMDPCLFNQMNCALYADDSTWVVPGSHRRDDTPEEIAAYATCPPLPPDVAGLDDQERELAGLAYLRRMPGATQLSLEPGDYCLWRNTLWHAGHYVPYRKRATLHDFVDTPAYAAWRRTKGRRYEPLAASGASANG
jgi:hypothetical protein